MTASRQPTSRFRPALFRFLTELAANNRRDWFEANRERYEEEVKDPALAFISDFGPALRRISPHFLAIPKATGGSLFRIHRDTRFARDKRPYKTQVGIHFRHARAKDAHAPGFYVHLEPAQSFLGVGIWHPDGPTLKNIREAIVADPTAWKRARDDRRFRAWFQLGGESLRSAPRGYAAEHPLIEDLRRTDFVGIAEIPRRTVLAPDFLTHVTDAFGAAAPFARFLCRAVEAPF